MTKLHTQTDLTSGILLLLLGTRGGKLMPLLHRDPEEKFLAISGTLWSSILCCMIPPNKISSVRQRAQFGLAAFLLKIFVRLWTEIKLLSKLRRRVIQNWHSKSSTLKTSGPKGFRIFHFSRRSWKEEAIPMIWFYDTVCYLLRKFLEIQIKRFLAATGIFGWTRN